MSGRQGGYDGMKVYRRIVVGCGEEGDDIGGTADSVAETSDL